MYVARPVALPMFFPDQVMGQDFLEGNLMVMCDVMGVKTNIFLLIDLRDFFVKFWGEGGGGIKINWKESLERSNKSLFVVCVLRLDVQVNNFLVMSGRSHRFLGIITSTFGE